MLESLDAVLGFSVVMLGVSLIVTVLVQTASSLVGLRGWALLRGLQTLFHQGGLDPAAARKLAERVLHHPLITDSFLASGVWARASALRKEELVRLLKEHEAYGLGVVEEAAKLLATVDSWFDSQMDRAAQFFVHFARIITIVVSLMLAFTLHLDAGSLIQRLYSDADLRAKLIASATVLESRAQDVDLGALANPAASAPATPAKAAANLDKSLAELRSLQRDLNGAGLDLLPHFASEPDLTHGIHSADDYFRREGLQHLLGVLATAALLSLGAPFWFNLLKQLTNLRSVVGNKEQKERDAPVDEAA